MLFVVFLVKLQLKSLWVFLLLTSLFLCFKVGDFGVSKIAVQTEESQKSSHAGTTAYIAPETVRGEAAVGPPIDMWAVGCLIHELITGEKTFTF